MGPFPSFGAERVGCTCRPGLLGLFKASHARLTGRVKAWRHRRLSPLGRRPSPHPRSPAGPIRASSSEGSSTAAVVRHAALLEAVMRTVSVEAFTLARQRGPAGARARARARAGEHTGWVGASPGPAGHFSSAPPASPLWESRGVSHASPSRTSKVLLERTMSYQRRWRWRRRRRRCVSVRSSARPIRRA